MIIIENIKLDPEDAAAIRKIDDARAANAAFAEQCRVAGERRNMELVQQGRDTWSRLAKKYNLDLAHIHYELTEGNDLKTVAVQLP